MRAAIYARFSSEKQSEASLDDQERICERICERNGFRIVRRFRDAAVSGGTQDRLGYQSMLTDSRQGEIDVIVAEDTSRLWRLLAEQAPRLAELADLGVHVVTQDLDTRQESASILGPVTGAMAEQYRKEIGRRTRRGLEGRARQQQPTGGRAYGYTVADGRRVIEPEQAETVRRIFAMYAEGHSPRTIAARLNAEGISSPGSHWNRKARRRKGWLASAIHGDPKKSNGILNNDLYQGLVIWNRSRWVRSAQDSKKRRQVMNPHSEWIEHRDESLRIVSDDLWQQVKARQQAQSQVRGSRVRKGMKRRPGGGRPPRYLFSGWLRCSECGSGLTLVNGRSYACSGHVNGGDCTNTTYYRRAELEDNLLQSIRADLVRPETFQAFERKLRAAAKSRRPKANDQRIRDLEQQVGNLVEAAAAGAFRNSPAIAQRLATAESELERLRLEQARASQRVNVTEILPRLKDHYLRVVDRLNRLDRAEDVERIRSEIRAVIAPEIIVKPPKDGWIEAYTPENETPLAAYAGGAAEIMVAGAGFEPATFGL